MSTLLFPYLVLCSLGPAPSPPTVTVHSQPPMASAFWDGRYVGATPLILRAVPPGRHGLKLTRYGYRNWVQLVTVQGADVKLDARLMPEVSGALRVESEPPEAKVYVNGEFHGRTPLALTGLPVGIVQVRVEKAEHLPAQQDAAIAADKTATVKVTLQPKLEAFLLAKIKTDPSRVTNHTELGHFYMMRRDYDRAFDTYARGMDACVSPKAIPNDCLRLYNELQYCHDGDVVKFADEANLEAFRQRFAKLFEDAIKRVPSNERNYWELATIRSRKKEWPACVALYEQAVKHARNSRIKHRAMRGAAQMRYRLGADIASKGDYVEAAAEYEKAIALYPMTYYARQAVSSAISLYQYRLNVPDKVDALRRGYLKTFPKCSTSPAYRRQLADALVARSRYKEALTEYQRFLKDYPDDDGCPELMVAMANCHQTKLNDPASALRVYLDCAERYPQYDGSAGALLSAAQIHQARGETVYAKAIHALIVKRYPCSADAEQVDDDPKRKQAREQAATLHAEATAKESVDKRTAIALYEKLIAACPATYQAPAAMLRIVAIHQNSTRDFGAEMAARARFVDLYPNSDQAPSQLMTMASRYTKESRHEEAIAAYRRLIKQFPDSDSCPTAYYQIGLIYHQKTYEQKKAIPEFRALATKWPDHSLAPASVYHIGWIYFLCLKGTSAQAIESFRELLTRYPYESYADSVEYWLDALQKTKPEPVAWWQ